MRSIVRPYGTIRKIVMPPSGLFAAVRFEEESDAASALNGLAYSRFGNSLLYVEMAPRGFWKVELTSPSESEKPKVSQVNGLEFTSGSCMLLVKNLAISTSTHLLQNIFSNTAGYKGARLFEQETKFSGTREGAIEFESREAALLAMKCMDGFVFDEHPLIVALADQRDGEPAALGDQRDGVTAASGESVMHETDKLIIKNLPFEIRRSELKGLLTYGLFRCC